jgi:hypothetical protein
VQIIGHGDDKKQDDQGAAHGHDLPPSSSLRARASRGGGQATAQQSDSYDCHAHPNEI